MTCKNCNSPAVAIVESNGGTTEGKFKEEYQCQTCNSKGWVSGDASREPQSWEKYGGVFE